MKNILEYDVNYDNALNIKNTIYFKRTNVIWNKYKLNSSYCIGNLMYLISLSKTNSPKEFEKWYLSNGEEREVFLLTIPNHVKQSLNTSDFIKKEMIKDSYYRINQKYGRTKEYLDRLTYHFYDLILQTYPDWLITIEEVKEFVYIRIFYETFLGSERERLTIHRLSCLYPYLTFQKTNEDFDVEYAVDVEVFSKTRLVCGLQIKSIKHMEDNIHSKKSVLYDVKRINNRKNERYKRTYQKDVHYIYSKLNGYILNKEDIDKLLKLYKYNKE